VARRAIARGVDGNGGKAKIAARAEDADGDLAAVGDQNLAQG
jgi:hypothetical protein